MTSNIKSDAWPILQVSVIALCVINKPLNRKITKIVSIYGYIWSNIMKLFKGALDNFSLFPKFFSKKLRFLYH